MTRTSRTLSLSLEQISTVTQKTSLDASLAAQINTVAKYKLGPRTVSRAVDMHRNVQDDVGIALEDMGTVAGGVNVDAVISEYTARETKDLIPTAPQTPPVAYGDRKSGADSRHRAMASMHG